MLSTQTTKNGFSLIEIMIAMGLVGIVALGIASMINQSNKAQSQTQSKFSHITLAQDIQTQLKDSSSCNLSLIVRSPITSTATPDVEVKLGNTQVKEGKILETYSGIKINKLRLENIAASGALPSGGQKFSADLVLSATSAKKFLYKPMVVTRLLLATNAAGNFQGCDGGSSAASLCQSLGGSYDPNASPPCALSGSQSGKTPRICTTGTSYQTRRQGRPEFKTCCTNEETSTCVVIDHKSESACHDGNCSNVTTKYLCHCVPK